MGSIPGSGKSSGEGNGSPLQFSCLENPVDGGAWWAAVHGVAKSRIRLSDFTLHSLQSGMPVEFLKSDSSGLQSQILWGLLLLLPGLQAGESDVGLRTFTPVGELLHAI